MNKHTHLLATELAEIRRSDFDGPSAATYPVERLPWLLEFLWRRTPGTLIAAGVWALVVLAVILSANPAENSLFVLLIGPFVGSVLLIYSINFFIGRVWVRQFWFEFLSDRIRFWQYAMSRSPTFDVTFISIRNVRMRRGMFYRMFSIADVVISYEYHQTGFEEMSTHVLYLYGNFGDVMPENKAVIPGQPLQRALALVERIENFGRIGCQHP